MARKKAYLLVGPAIPGVHELHEELGAQRETLDAAGLALPNVPQSDLFRAGLEIRRTHKAEGLRRKDVEGAWSAVCRAAEKTRSDVLIGQDVYAAASPEQIALLLDALAAFKTHVVVTLPAGATGVDDLLEPWTLAVKAQRLHVLTLAEGDGLERVLTEVSALALRERASQCGCQASSSAVRAVTSSGSLRSASWPIVTRSNTSRSECRAAIHTCWSTSARSL
jgi:hypothetical protein